MNNKTQYSRKDVENIITATQASATKRVAKELLEDLFSWVGITYRLHPEETKAEFSERVRERIRKIGQSKKYGVWNEEEK